MLRIEIQAKIIITAPKVEPDPASLDHLAGRYVLATEHALNELGVVHSSGLFRYGIRVHIDPGTIKVLGP